MWDTVESFLKVHLVLRVLQCVCVCVLFLPVVVLNLSKIVPFERGFFCDDDSIKLPHKGDTISSGLLFALGLCIPIAAIICGEAAAMKFHQEHHNGALVRSSRQLYLALYLHLGAFLFGAAVSQSLTEVAKFAIGRLRPHFLDVCKPLNLTERCAGSYIPEALCTGDASRVADARKSFYSGHSSFSSYTMIFLALYLQVRMPWRGTRLLRPLLQFAAILGAFYVGLSRISDHKHHWSDVLTGFFQGTIVAMLVVFYVADFFRMSHKIEEPAHDGRRMDTVNAANSV
uniref:Phospholipid phosphatase 1a n=1 Tax=Eptatretus burgeri TaxID=7764 RepID=A0A8C4QPT6_EPTBU